MRQAARDESLEGIYKVETVPPPPGEDDAYNAETKVGALAKAAISKLLAEAEEAERREGSGAPPASQIRPSATAKLEAQPKPVVATAPAAMPVLWSDEDGEGSQAALEPTGLLEVAGPPSGARERNTSPLPYPAVRPPPPPTSALPPPAFPMQTFEAAPIVAPVVPAAPSRRRLSTDVVIAIATFAIVAGLAALVLSFLR